MAIQIISQSRRGFLGTGLGWLGAQALAGAAPLERRAKTISIFHTTDLHGHIVPTQTYEHVGDVGGLARCMTQIRRWRKECPDSLLVDIGDVYQGTPASWNTRGKLMLNLFNRLGYDAWAIGNHDIDWGRENLETALNLSNSPIVSGNLTVDAKSIGSITGAWEKVKPWVIREVGGFRIALIGLTTPGLPYWLSTKTLGGIAPLDPMATLARSIAEVKAEKADAVVVMGHMGWRFQDDYANPVRELLTKVDGVDIFLAGHSHQDQPYFMVKDVVCSQASYYGIHCGRVDLTFDLDSRKLLDRKAFTVRMDSRFELDPLVMEVAKSDLDVADEQMKRKVWDAREMITGTGRGSQLWAIMCTAFAESLKKHQQPVDGIFHGTFNTGDEDPGVKTVADVWRWLPYENELTVADLSGADLIEIMKESRSFKKSDRELWPFKLDMAADGKVSSFTLEGQPVDMAKKYRIGMNSYDAQSGGRDLNKLADLVSRPDARRVDTSLPTREALIDYLLSLS